MFGNHSGSGSVGTLTVLAAVALGTLLTPLDCTIARAQQPDLNLRLTNADVLPFEDDESNEAVQSTVLSDIPSSVRQTRSLRGRGTSASSATTVSFLAQGQTRSTQHPWWLTDLDSKMRPGLMSGLR